MYGNKTKVEKPKKKVEGISGISDKMAKRLREHSKQHKGGMSSPHIKNMLKFLREKKSFKKAHEMAIELDKKEEKK